MDSRQRLRKKNIWTTRTVRERRGFALAVFFIFAPIGALSSLMAVANPLWLLWYVALYMLISGLLASAIILAIHRFWMLVLCTFLFVLGIVGLASLRKTFVAHSEQGSATTTAEEKTATAAVMAYQNVAQSTARRDGILAMVMIGLGYTFVVRVLGREWEDRAKHNAEMQIARRIQSSLTPAGSKKIPGFEIVGITQPATEVAGDHFDYLDLGANKLGILIADAAGHGVAAGLLTAMMKGALSLIAGENKPPERVMAELNRVVHRLAPRNMFVTASYTIIDTATGDLTFVTAGHEPLLLIRSAERSVQQLRTSGMALGLRPDAAFSAQHASLAKGDTLLLYTDGVVEAENLAGEDFGISRLESLLLSIHQLSAKEIGNRIISESTVHRNKNAQADDMSLVVVRRSTHM